jgi:hypothetical protein
VDSASTFLNQNDDPGEPLVRQMAKPRGAIRSGLPMIEQTPPALSGGKSSPDGPERGAVIQGVGRLLSFRDEELVESAVKVIRKLIHKLIQGRRLSDVDAILSDRPKGYEV